MSGRGSSAGGRPAAGAGGVGSKRKRPDDGPKQRGRPGSAGPGKGGPRGDSKGPRGDGKGPRGDSKGPRGDSKGPRGDSKGPRGPRGDSKGPRGDSKGPHSGSKGPRGDGKGPRGKPFGGAGGGGKRDGDKGASGGPGKGQKLAPGVYKGSKPHAELNDKLVRNWNELRERATPKPRKEELVKEVLALITGRVMDVVMRHDASRVVQACLKHGNAAQRDSVCRELFGHALEMTKAKHGHQLIEKMLLYGSTAVRAQLARELKGHIARLVTHNIGALVVETGFAKAWPPATCWELYQELFGSEWVHMKADASCGRTLGGLLAAHPAKRKSVFESMFYVLSKQADKKLFGLHVAHRLLADFLEHAPPEQAVGMLGLARDHILSLCTTRDGARAAAALWGLGTPKDRKAMWKAWKGRLFDLATHEHGHLALVAALDVTDDTRTSGDALWEELRPHLPLLALHKHARKVLLHLLAPRSPRYFSVFDLKVLAPVTLPAYLANRKAPAGEGDAPATGGAAGAAAAAGGAGEASGKAESGEAALAAAAAAAATKASGKREREPLAIPAPPPAEIASDAAAMAPTATSKKADAQRRAELLAPVRGDLESALLTHTALLGRSEYGMGVLYEGAMWLRASAPAAAAAAAAAAAKADKGGKKGGAAAAAAGAAGAAGPTAAAGSAAVSDGRAVFEAIADLLIDEPTGDELQEQLAALQAASVAASAAVPAELGGSGGGGSGAAADAEAPAAKRARKDGDGDAAEGEGEGDAEDKEADGEEDEDEDDGDDDDEDASEPEADVAGAAAAGGAGKAAKPAAAGGGAAAGDAEAEDIFLPFAEHPPSHLLLKWLLQRESTRNTDAAAGAADEPVFGPLAQARLAGKLAALCGSSRGAFIALELLQSRHAATASAVRSELTAAIGALKGYKYKPDAGLMLLLERLQGTGKASAPAKATATPGGKKGKMDVDTPAGGAGSGAAAAPKSAAKESAPVAPKSSAKAADAAAPKSAAKPASSVSDSSAAVPPKSAAKSRPSSARK